MTVIVYVVDMSAFNENLDEDPSINRLNEALSVFKDIWLNRYLSNVSVILFLNKYDLFAEKINVQNWKLEDYFPSFNTYTLPDVINKCYLVPEESEQVFKAKMFILQLFIDMSLELRLPSNRNVASKFMMPFFTSAVNVNNMKRVFDVCEIVMRKEAMKKLYII